jgi:hypothetical protein
MLNKVKGCEDNIEGVSKPNENLNFDQCHVKFNSMNLNVSCVNGLVFIS